MGAAVNPEGDALEALAFEKMSRVLGPTRAQQLRTQVMTEAGLTRIADAEDLLRFAKVLMTRSGFEGSVGALLSVQASIRGARG